MDPDKIHDYEIADEFITVYISKKLKVQKKRKYSFKKKQKLMKSLKRYDNFICAGPYLDNYENPKYPKYCSNTRTKYYRKVAARKFRHNKDLENPRDKSYYRKAFDYKWSID